MSGVTLGEINVVCTDLEAALGFSRDALGLSEADIEDGAVRLDFGRVSLLLLPAAEQRRRSGSATGGGRRYAPWRHRGLARRVGMSTTQRSA
jgi:catechol 2,3-dioxygenase-like lactoylglutathione lyase family enzyme